MYAPGNAGASMSLYNASTCWLVCMRASLPQLLLTVWSQQLLRLLGSLI